MKYKVVHFEDEIYYVYEADEVGWVYSSTILFRGTLADCLAWITLKEKNYI